MCVLCYSLFVCISAYANVYFKTTSKQQNIKITLLQTNIHVSEAYSGSAVLFGQALAGYLITAHHLEKPRENGSENRFLSRVRSAAKRECEP